MSTSSEEEVKFRKPGAGAEAEEATPAEETTEEVDKTGAAEGKEPQQAVEQGRQKEDAKEPQQATKRERQEEDSKDAQPREAGKAPRDSGKESGSKEKKNRGGSRCNAKRADRIECRICRREIVDCPSGWAQHLSSQYCLSRRYYKEGWGNWAWCVWMAEQNAPHEWARWQEWQRGQQRPPEPKGPPMTSPTVPASEIVMRSRSRRKSRHVAEKSCDREQSLEATGSTRRRRSRHESSDRHSREREGRSQRRRRVQSDERRSRRKDASREESERNRRRRRREDVPPQFQKSRSQEQEEERTREHFRRLEEQKKKEQRLE